MPTETGSDVRNLATARLMAAGSRVTGVGKVGLLTSGLSILGLAPIRCGRKTQGLALLAASGVLALLRHERDDAVTAGAGSEKVLAERRLGVTKRPWQEA